MMQSYGASPPQQPAQEPAEEPAPAPHGPGIGGRIRNWFLTGIVVAGPLAVTLYLVWWFVDTVDNWVKKIIPVKFWPDFICPSPCRASG